MQLKGLRITRKADSTYEVVPLYYSKRGGTRVGTQYRATGKDLLALVVGAVEKLVARGDLAG